MRGLLKFFTILAVLGGLYYARWYMSYRQVERDSSFFVTDAVNKISSGWSMTEFSSLADGSLKTAAMESALAGYRKLGAMVKPASCELKDFTSYRYKGTANNYIGATYECHAAFANGPATVQLVIERFQDTAMWKIWDFHVFSPYFSALKP